MLVNHDGTAVFQPFSRQSVPQTLPPPPDVSAGVPGKDEEALRSVQEQLPAGANPVVLLAELWKGEQIQYLRKQLDDGSHELTAITNPKHPRVLAVGLGVSPFCARRLPGFLPPHHRKTLSQPRRGCTVDRCRCAGKTKASAKRAAALGVLDSQKLLKPQRKEPASGASGRGRPRRGESPERRTRERGGRETDWTSDVGRGRGRGRGGGREAPPGRGGKRGTRPSDADWTREKDGKGKRARVDADAPEQTLAKAEEFLQKMMQMGMTGYGGVASSSTKGYGGSAPATGGYGARAKAPSGWKGSSGGSAAAVRPATTEAPPVPKWKLEPTTDAGGDGDGSEDGEIM